jgi:hypothetical protein
MSDDDNFVLLSCTPEQLKKMINEVYSIKKVEASKPIKKEDFTLAEQQFFENYIRFIKRLYN